MVVRVHIIVVHVHACYIINTLTYIAHFRYLQIYIFPTCGYVYYYILCSVP